MIYDVKYNSVNKYEEPVSEAIFEFLVLPCNEKGQTLLEHSIRHSSEGEPFYCNNSFGFKTIRIRAAKFFKEFNFSFSSKVDKQEIKELPMDTLSLPDQLALMKSQEFFIDHHLFLSDTPFTKISRKNHSSSYLYNKKTSVLNYLIQLNDYIYSFLSYQPNLTTVQTTADEVMKIKKGVCQDYTHLFVGMARQSGIPTRYVSGYLNQGKNYVGAAMMHAWAEAFAPGIGWIGFDPTNNLQINDHYIKVCHGKDYSDCTPIKGVLITKGDNSTHHQVEVSQQ